MKGMRGPKGKASRTILFATGVRSFRSVNSSVKGFTLLEVLVAVALLGIAITVVLQLFSADLRAIAVSEEYVSAAAKAEAKMREVQDNDTLAEGSTSDITNDGYRLDVSVTSTLSERTETLQVMLMDILVTVYWTKGAKQRSLSLRTMKLVNKQI
jgi:prepilin-type N-terminal cleavage/methylation domain-containing protein